MDEINVVGYPLAEAVTLLSTNDITYEVVPTAPPNGRTLLSTDCWVVLRQTFLQPAVCQLIVALKIQPAYL